MKSFTKRTVLILSVTIIFLCGYSAPGYPRAERGELSLSNIVCVADGNNTSITATVLTTADTVDDAVCADDQFDWYQIPLTGDVHWGGMIACATNSPGLSVKFYRNTGAGPEMVAEASPALSPMFGEGIYVLMWDVEELATTLGFTDLQPGNYYVRVTYFAAHPGLHQYELLTKIDPVAFDESPFNTAATARTLQPGFMHYGHLNGADSLDWFAFDLTPGQVGSGLVFGAKMRADVEHEGELLQLMPDEGGPGEFDINIRNAAHELIATTSVHGYSMGTVDFRGLMLGAGRYFIEITNPGKAGDASWGVYYLLLNHALAPNDGAWGPDLNVDIGSAAPITEGVPVSGSIYFPRDWSDFYSFHSTGYFLGDIKIEGSGTNMGAFYGMLTNAEGHYTPTRMVPGIGLSCAYSPRPPGDYNVVLSERYRMFAPTEYTATLYTHGVPMTGPIGHSTWETALGAPPEAGLLHVVEFEGEEPKPDVVIDFEPGIQDVFFTTLEVPEDNLLAGYYQFTGSRNNYRVRLGKLGPGGVPVWAPALDPDIQGRLFIDLNFDFLSDAGTYFVKVEMRPESAARTRIFIEDHSFFAQCDGDYNNTFDTGVNLKGETDGSNYVRESWVCPVEDDVDWYMFDSGLFDDFYGPKQNLFMRGAAEGMRVELYDGNLVFLRGVDIDEQGGSAEIDLDGVILDQWHYYVKVIAAPGVDRVQVYDLEIRKDITIFLPPFDFRFRRIIEPDDIFRNLRFD